MSDKNVSDPTILNKSAISNNSSTTKSLSELNASDNPLSKVHYDAFISYKHGELDAAVAVRLQQLLERLKVPKGVSQKPGKRPIQRVFVDEGELASCADFSALLHEALKHSEYLIVICSSETPKSEWVNLEIETFLKYHSRDHLLAVLVEGEPENSFPPELQSCNGHSEVLAADARARNISSCLEKLKNNALLRIAAPILGTTYDTLKQRRQNYLLKRNFSIASVIVIALLGFLSYSLVQEFHLQKEYLNTRKNQAKLLANEALSAYSKGNVIDALRNVLQIQEDPDDNTTLELLSTLHQEELLEGLLDYSKEQALVPEQEYALNSILKSNNADSFYFFPYKELPEKVFTNSSLSKDQKLLAGLDQSKSAVFVDPATGKIIRRVACYDIPYTLSKGWDYIYAVSENTAILYGNADIVGIHIDTGEVFAHMANQEGFVNTDTVTPIVYDGEELKTAFASHSYNIYVFNLSTETLEGQCSLKTYSSDKKLAFSSSGDALYIGSSDSASFGEITGLFVYSLENDELTQISDEPVSFINETSDHKLLVIYSNDSNLQYESNFWVAGKNKNYRICIYNIDDTFISENAAPIYEETLGYFPQVASNGFELDCIDSQVAENHSLFAVWIGHTLNIYDLNQLALYQQYSMSSYITDVTPLQNKFLAITLKNGTGYLINITQREIQNTNALFDLDAEIKHTYFINDTCDLALELADKLIWLNAELDSSIKQVSLNGKKLECIEYTKDQNESYRVVRMTYNDHPTVTSGFYVYRSNSNELLFSYEADCSKYPDDFTPPDIKPLNLENGVLTFSVQSDSYYNYSDEDLDHPYEFILYQADMKTGNIINSIDLSDYGKYLGYFNSWMYCGAAHRLYAVRPQGGVVYFDLSTQKAVPCDKPLLSNKEIEQLVRSWDSRYLMIISQNSSTYGHAPEIWIYDSSTNELHNTGFFYLTHDEINASFEKSSARFGSCSSKFAFYDARNYILYIYDCEKKKILSSIEFQNQLSTNCFQFIDHDQKLLLFDQNQLNLYDCATGELLNSTDLNHLEHYYPLYLDYMLTTDSDSSFFSIECMNRNNVTYDSISLKPCTFVFKYNENDNSIYPINGIMSGIFDPYSQEISTKYTSSFCYSRLHSFSELITRASEQLSDQFSD